MILGQDGAVYITELAGRLLRVDTSNWSMRTVAEGLAGPEGLAQTPSGKFIVAEAAKRGIAFERFSLQDCRPMAVTAKLDRGDTDTQNATGHTSDAMIQKHYDRRKLKVAGGAPALRNTE